MSAKITPEIQLIFDRLAAMPGRGYHIRYYPVLSTLSGNPAFSIVLSRLLYHEDLRLHRHAAFFAATDPQLASECGLGEYQFGAARDLICAPGIELFTRTRRGQPPINHYHGNLDRIHAWLTSNGFGQIVLPGAAPPGPSSGKNPELDAGKTANSKEEKPTPLKNLFSINQENSVGDDGDAPNSDDDDVTYHQLNGLLKHYQIDQPKRGTIARRLASRARQTDGDDWRPMAMRVINAWRLAKAAHAAGRVGNDAGFTGFFVYKLELLDADYLATGDERAAQRDQVAGMDAVQIAQMVETWRK
jgi:hypothetical protein